MEQINGGKLITDISDLSRYNENFVQNLQILKKNVTQKLESVSAFAQLTVEAICRNRLEECNYLCKSLNEIREQVECMSRNEKLVMGNYKKLGKVRDVPFIVN